METGSGESSHGPKELKRCYDPVENKQAADRKKKEVGRKGNRRTRMKKLEIVPQVAPKKIQPQLNSNQTLLPL